MVYLPSGSGASVTLTRCILRGNEVEQGGAIEATGDFTLTVIGCSFESNIATRYCCGAIYFEDVTGLTITDTTFTANTAITHAPAVRWYGHGTSVYGGGISGGDFTNDAANAAFGSSASSG